MKETVLITGINGFAASHLARKLVELGYDVHGTVRVRSDLHRIKDIMKDVKLHLVELTDSHSVNAVLDEVIPDHIYHLAAQSYVKSSWETPNETMRINYTGTVNILESVRTNLIGNTKVLVTSTSEVYGHVDGDIDEKTPPKPNTPYGISKYAQEMIALTYARAFNMNVKVTRSFNITGAGRASVFVDSDFAKQIVEIEKGKRKPIIKHGNLNSARDFISVHDAVDGYIKVLTKGKTGQIYCLASGKPRTIQTVLETLIKNTKSKKEIITQLDSKRLRPIDTPTMKGVATKITKELGWKYSNDFDKSMKELLNYWREII